jgi:NADH:ubiquinone oxidoreductase subunit 2 (subunit N)
LPALLVLGPRCSSSASICSRRRAGTSSRSCSCRSRASAGAAWLLLQRLHLARRPLAAFGGSIVLDDLTSFLSLAILMMTALLILVANVDTRRRNVAFGEYYGLVLSCTAAMMLLLASTDLLMIFLNLEILSIALYVLTGITRKNRGRTKRPSSTW